MAKNRRNAKWEEVGWLFARDMKGLLATLTSLRHEGTSERKRRLFDVACARRVTHLFPDDVCRQVVECCERCVEESALRKGEQFKGLRAAVEARLEAHRVAPDCQSPHHLNPLSRAAYDLARYLLDDYPRFDGFHYENAVRAAAKLEDGESLQIVTLRDIFGNPFRPVSFSPLWRTDTALALANQMYESHDFGAMPILADALQDAGCDSAAILAHCRDARQVHVRGCWVVDLVLDKT